MNRDLQDGVWKNSPYKNNVSSTEFVLLGLAHTVTSVLCLFVVVGIAVDVMEDDDVRRGEVDAQAPGTRRQQEHKYVRIRVVLVNQPDPAGQRKHLSNYMGHNSCSQSLIANIAGLFEIIIVHNDVTARTKEYLLAKGLPINPNIGIYQGSYTF